MTDETKPLPSKRGRKPGTTFKQRPRTEHEAAKRVAIPPAPTVSRAEDKAAADAQQTARVEVLLLKGVTSARLIGTMLGIESEREVNRLVGLVQARWVVLGSARDLKRARGEALARYSMIEQEVWAKLSDNGDLKPSDRMSMLKVLLEISDQRNMLLGLQPAVTAKMALMPETSNIMTTKLSAQAELRTTAERFLEVLADRRARLGAPTIEHDAAEDYSTDAEISRH